MMLKSSMYNDGVCAYLAFDESNTPMFLSIPDVYLTADTPDI